MNISPPPEAYRIVHFPSLTIFLVVFSGAVSVYSIILYAPCLVLAIHIRTLAWRSQYLFFFLLPPGPHVSACFNKRTNDLRIVATGFFRKIWAFEQRRTPANM